MENKLRKTQSEKENILGEASIVREKLKDECDMIHILEHTILTNNVKIQNTRKDLEMELAQNFCWDIQ
jgi:hypothetical protein